MIITSTEYEKIPVHLMDRCAPEFVEKAAVFYDLQGKFDCANIYCSRCPFNKKNLCAKPPVEKFFDIESIKKSQPELFI